MLQTHDGSRTATYIYATSARRGRLPQHINSFNADGIKALELIIITRRFFHMMNNTARVSRISGAGEKEHTIALAPLSPLDAARPRRSARRQFIKDFLCPPP